MRILSIKTVRHVARLLGIASMAATAVAAYADYPERPARIVVPFTPGGAADIAARTMGQQLADRFKQPFVALNKPGASGAIAADFVAKSAPDGYTLLVADMGMLAINPALNPKLPYQVARDLRPVSAIALVPQFIAVNPSLPITSVQTMVDHAKAHPGVTYGTPGVGTSHHLEMAALAKQAGIDLRHVPYKGGAQTIPAVIAGEIDMTISAYGALRQQVQAGKVRLIAVATGTRSPLAPDVPAVSETLPGYALSDAVGLLAPAGTPDHVITALSKAMTAAGSSAEFVSRLADLGLEAKVDGSQSYARMIDDASRSFQPLVQSLGLKTE